MNFSYPYYNLENYYQKSRKNVNGKMIVGGIGNVEVQPNVAYVTLGVITENKELKLAQQENMLKTNAVINSLENAGINKNNIKTQQYLIEPQYNYIDGKQIFRAYNVSNILEITLHDLKNIGEIIDLAVENGANIVRNINFDVADSSKYYLQALNLAVKNTVKKAISLEATLNIKVNPVPLNIVEQNKNNIAVESTLLKASNMPTPILSGPIKISAEVKALFLYNII